MLVAQPVSALPANAKSVLSLGMATRNPGTAKPQPDLKTKAA